MTISKLANFRTGRNFDSLVASLYTWSQYRHPSLDRVPFQQWKILSNLCHTGDFLLEIGFTDKLATFPIFLVSRVWYLRGCKSPIKCTIPRGDYSWQYPISNGIQPLMTIWNLTPLARAVCMVKCQVQVHSLDSHLLQTKYQSHGKYMEWLVHTWKVVDSKCVIAT